MSMKPIKVALLGIGTVGSGVFKVLQRNQTEIKARTGRGIEITLVADRAADHARSIVGNTTEVITDAFAAVTRPEIDIVVELIGGYTVAKELVLKAIENGKHVVTANKALLADQGAEDVQGLLASKSEPDNNDNQNNNDNSLIDWSWWSMTGNDADAVSFSEPGRSGQHDAQRVQVGVHDVVVLLDLHEVDRVAETGGLVQVAGVAPQCR